MYDSRIGAAHSIPHHVGDVWDDDHADGTNGSRRRLLRGGGAVRGGGRADAQQEKKKALNRPKYQRQNKTTRL